MALAPRLRDASRAFRARRTDMSLATFPQRERYSVVVDETLLDRYLRVRRHTETLGAPLDPEDTVVQSMPDASPVKWHLGHTTWFFEAFLVSANLTGYSKFEPRFDYLFN